MKFCTYNHQGYNYLHDLWLTPVEIKYNHAVLGRRSNLTAVYINSQSTMVYPTCAFMYSTIVTKCLYFVYLSKTLYSPRVYIFEYNLQSPSTKYTETLSINIEERKTSQ
jgi:hypothetical protein